MSNRIINIEAKNFRAFGTRPLKINLTKSGRNLLAYGENGSGKSSLFFAIRDFLETAERAPAKRDVTLVPFRNIFTTSDDGYIKLQFSGLPKPAAPAGKVKAKKVVNPFFEWSKAKDDTSDPLILEINKTKGFIDYKALLATYLLQDDKDTIDIFKLLITSILRHVENDVTTGKFGEEWDAVKQQFEKVNYRSKTQKTALEDSVRDFNNGLIEKLKEVRTTAKRLLDKFGYHLDLEFNVAGGLFDGSKKTLTTPVVGLKVTFYDEERDDHHLFLNEAKLSAIAISIFFAALLLQPPSRLRILALDDVLIGLDMSNRLPVLDILQDEFADYQIFFFTYDKAWYDIVWNRFKDGNWKSIEFYAGSTDSHDLPIYCENTDYLKAAEDYVTAKDFKAAMVYLRTYLELKFKNYCQDKGIPVKYQKNPKDYSLEHFWKAVSTAKKKDGTDLIEPATVKAFETYRSVAINPLCHASFAAMHMKEVVESIKLAKTIVKALEDAKAPALAAAPAAAALAPAPAPAP